VIGGKGTGKRYINRRVKKRRDKVYKDVGMVKRAKETGKREEKNVGK